MGPSESESLVWLSLGLLGIIVTSAHSVFTLRPCGLSGRPSADLQGNHGNASNTTNWWFAYFAPTLMRYGGYHLCGNSTCGTSTTVLECYITQRAPHLRLLSSDGAFSSLCIWSSPASHRVLNGFSPLELKSNSPLEQELSSVAFLISGATPWDSGAPLLWVSPLATETFEQDSSPEAPWSPSLSFNEVDIPWDKRGEDLRSAGWPEVSDVFCAAAAVGGSDFLLVLASFLLFWAKASAAFFVPREWRVEEDEVFFVVHPVFFGWEDLAEGDQ